ncbi:MAG: tetratricopeptide repeat protein [Gemmatimonadales bacterium]
MLEPRRFNIIALLLAIFAVTPATVRAQEVDTRAPAVIEASSLRDSAKFNEAIEVLRKHREANPDDGDAIRLLAQTLYWIKDMKGARALYDSAIVLHPDDTTLRLQYAEMLMETSDAVKAREILAPLLASTPPNPKATALSGTMAYWEGDFTTAARLFREALAGDSSITDAQRQLAEIRAFAAPWFRVAGGGLHDDQPLDRWGGEVEGGYYITPLFSVKARTGSEFLSDPGTSTGAGVSASPVIVRGSLGLNASFPSSRTDLAVEGGVIQRTDPSKLDWTGVAAFGIRPSPFFRLGVRGERGPYLHTAASLRIPVMINDFAGTIDVDRKGWLGRAAYQLTRFPDDNSSTSAYAWGMAPLVRATGLTLQGGYGASYQNAQELRFVVNTGAINLPGIGKSGHYEPYYTPQNVVTHSVVAALTGYDQHGFVGRLGGSYGFHATEDAPSFTPATGTSSGALVLSSRTFHPWTARASVERQFSGRGSVSARVDRFKTAFYTATSGALELTWRLASR